MCPLEDLKLEELADLCLAGLLDQVLPREELSNSSQGYFMHNEALLRKWVPHSVSFTGDPTVQIVVLSTFCEPVLKLAHYNSGNLDVMPCVVSFVYV